MNFPLVGPRLLKRLSTIKIKPVEATTSSFAHHINPPHVYMYKGTLTIISVKFEQNAIIMNGGPH